MTKEEYIDDLDYIAGIVKQNKKLINENVQLEQENKQLKEDKKKAIEYIKNNTLYYENYDYNIEDDLELTYVFDDKAREDLLEILGDKE